MNIHVNTGSKWTALAMATAALVLAPFNGEGICIGCSWTVRLSYPMFHASLLHAFCNAWCLITLVFYYDLHFRKILTAYLVAISVPAFALSVTPAVGMSGICFALMGLTVYAVRRKAMFVSWVAVFLAVGIFVPGMAWIIHLYCFAAGLFVGLFTSPVIRR